MTLTQCNVSPFTGEMSSRYELSLLRQTTARLGAQIKRLTAPGAHPDREWARIEAQLYLAERGLREASLAGSQAAARALEEIEAAV